MPQTDADNTGIAEHKIRWVSFCIARREWCREGEHWVGKGEIMYAKLIAGMATARYCTRCIVHQLQHLQDSAVDKEAK